LGRKCDINAPPRRPGSIQRPDPQSQVGYSGSTVWNSDLFGAGLRPRDGGRKCHPAAKVLTAVLVNQ
jgi:hypothetical protein